MNIIAIIPAYNEEFTISKVILDVKPYVNEVVVVNDGSTDQTSSIALSRPCTVLFHPINRGLGAALRTGFAYALSTDSDIIITFDADSQHTAKDIPRLISKLMEGYDVVIGSRMKEKGMPYSRVLANKFANMVTHGGHITTDSQSGLRAFKARALNKLDLHSDRMEISSEIISQVYKKGLRFSEISIKPIYTDYSLSKGQSLFTGLVTLVRLMFVRVFK